MTRYANDERSIPHTTIRLAEQIVLARHGGIAARGLTTLSVAAGPADGFPTPGLAPSVAVDAMQRAYDPTKITVTMVDDEPIALDVLMRAARSWNFGCQAAASAEEAIALLDGSLTPVVVTDLKMPGRGGVWLVQEIRRRWPEVAVIVMTAGQDANCAPQCLQAGAHHYFLKPFNLDEFHHVLEIAHRTYDLEQEKNRYRRELERKVHRQTQRTRHTFLSAIDSLVRAMEERDPYTAGHSARVRRYTVQLGRAVGLNSRQVKRLSLAARLHDIGKVGIPEAVLHKAGPLDPAEEALIREHPVIGERILTPIVRSREVLAAIRGHHERLDGSGYPDGLIGDCIPLLARLIAVPDCFDALTSRRAYQEPRTVAHAFEVLRAGAGTLFQDEFVNAFVRAHGAKAERSLGPA
jgi:response regulator RpfG family c-di-GMP phosphodiesterase